MKVKAISSEENATINHDECREYYIDFMLISWIFFLKKNINLLSDRESKMMVLSIQINNIGGLRLAPDTF